MITKHRFFYGSCFFLGFLDKNINQRIGRMSVDVNQVSMASECQSNVDQMLTE